MAVNIKELAWIILLLYKHNGEAVVDFPDDEYICHLFLGGERMPVFYEELHCLIENDILDLDYGVDEPGYERRVYRLSEEAIKKTEEEIRKVIKEKKKRRLDE